MRIFKNKFLVKLIATICLFLTLFNFTGVNRVYAEDPDEVGLGGILLTPIASLMVGIGTAVTSILNQSLYSLEVNEIKISSNSSFWSKWGTTIVLTIITVVCAVAAFFTAGATAGFAAGFAKVAMGAAVASFALGTVELSTQLYLGDGSIGKIAGMVVNGTMLSDEFFLPVYRVSPEEIFSNRIALFNMNFFEDEEIIRENLLLNSKVIQSGTFKNLHKDIVEIAENPALKDGYSQQQVKSYQSISTLLQTIANNYNIGIETWYINRLSYMDESLLDYGGYARIAIGPEQKRESVQYAIICNKNNEEVRIYEGQNALTLMTIWDKEATRYTDATKPELNLTEEEKKAEENKLFTVGISLYEGQISESEDTNVFMTLRNGIATWYVLIRNIALLVLMLILLYIGIRIVIGSTAGEKAKYKERLVDWLIAVCLIFVMHYIMAFAVNIVEKITDLIKNDKEIVTLYIPLEGPQLENAKEALKGFNTTGDGDAFDGDTLVWNTNLMGAFFMKAQLTKAGTLAFVGASFCYVLVVIYTVFFGFTYLRRVIYMAFLTMIAPLVAMTYPIDKMTDGKAQAFDSWLKEYIFNLMIQPLHLLLYTIFVSSAYMLVVDNALYALVALGFLMPAEKLMRKFFGFEKAKTPGLLGGAAGAAIAMTGLQSLTKPRHKVGKISDSGDSKTGTSQGQDNIKMSNKGSIKAEEQMLQYSGQKPEATKDTTVASDDGKVENSSTLEANEDVETPAKTLSMDSKDEGSPASKDGSYITRDGTGSGTSKQSNSKNRHVFRAAGTLIGTALKGKHPISWLGKAYAGATVGTAGLLLGISSGDPNKVLQYTTTGAMAGSALAKSVTEANRMRLENLKTAKGKAMRAYYGENYREYITKQDKKMFLKDKGKQDFLQTTLGVTREDSKIIMDKIGAKCYDNGITNIEDIATICKLMDKEGLTFEKAVAARSYLKKRLPSSVNVSTMPKTKREQYIKTWAEEFKEMDGTLTDEQAHKIANDTFKLVKSYDSQQSSLYKNLVDKDNYHFEVPEEWKKS